MRALVEGHAAGLSGTTVSGDWGVVSNWLCQEQNGQMDNNTAFEAPASFFGDDRMEMYQSRCGLVTCRALHKLPYL